MLAPHRSGRSGGAWRLVAPRAGGAALALFATLAGGAAFANASLGGSGLASWYGPAFQGRRTANGESFDSRGLTAAHRSLPLGTLIQVVNTDNGRTALLRINDRGPYVAGRDLDVSQLGAEQLGFAARGVAHVRFTVVSPDAPRERAASHSYAELAQVPLPAPASFRQPRLRGLVGIAWPTRTHEIVLRGLVS